jgi:uncharacterized phage protein (TIGR02218 family)
MKQASPELIAILASRQFFIVDLYQFNLNSGEQLNYCNGDMDIKWNNIIWSCGGASGPYFNRNGQGSKCSWKIGVSVDSLSFDILPKDAAINGLAFVTAVKQGVFDGAELTLYRAFMPNYNDVAAGTVIMFAGRIAEIEASSSLINVTVNSHLELLNQNLPRNLYQAACLNTLFDNACGLNKASLAINGSVLAGSSDLIINANLSQISGYFDMGVIKFTSGVNNGLSRTIKSYNKSTISNINIISPLPKPLSIGDNFTIYAGCDKQQTTCKNKFNNINRFRGFPYIPENSTAV